MNEELKQAVRSLAEAKGMMERTVASDRPVDMAETTAAAITLRKLDGLVKDCSRLAGQIARDAQ